jgi:hypothetical protein
LPRMKRFILSVLSICLILGLSGCNAAPPVESNFNLIFRYGVGAKNELNTFEGTFTRDMVLDPSITVKLSLSQEELDRIYQKMAEIDFFNYPDEFSVTVPAGEPAVIKTPYSTYYFKVEYDSKIKELWWVDEIHNQNTEADKLRELVSLIINAISATEEFKKLPTPKGGYL